MADMTWSSLTELQQWNAANLNAYFQSIESGLNDLEGYAVQDYGIGYWNLDATIALVKLDGTPDPTVRIDTVFPTGFTNRYDVFGSHVMATDPHDTSSPDTGWAVVDNFAGTQLKVEWSGGYTLGMGGASRVAGIMVTAESHVRYVRQIAVDDNGTPNTGKPHWVAFALQWKDSGGNWETIPKTERFIGTYSLQGHSYTIGGGSDDAETVICFPFTLRTMLLPSDVDSAVYGVRLVVANFGSRTTEQQAFVANGNTTSATQLCNNGGRTYLGEGSITAFPIHAKVM